MSSDGTSSTDGRTLTAAIENFAERLDGLIGAVDRLTNCLTPMPYEYGPPPPYPPSIVNLVVVEGMEQAEFPSDGQIQTTSSSSSSSDSSEDSSTSSWDEESDSTMALSDVFKILDLGLYHQFEFDEDDKQTVTGGITGLPTDIISTRSARENSSREGEEDVIVGSTIGDMPEEQIDDEEDEHTCTKCSEDEDNGKDDDEDEDDIQTARSVPSETDLTVKKEGRSI